MRARPPLGQHRVNRADGRQADDRHCQQRKHDLIANRPTHRGFLASRSCHINLLAIADRLSKKSTACRTFDSRLVIRTARLFASNSRVADVLCEIPATDRCEWQPLSSADDTLMKRRPTALDSAQSCREPLTRLDDSSYVALVQEPNSEMQSIGTSFAASCGVHVSWSCLW